MLAQPRQAAYRIPVSNDLVLQASHASNRQQWQLCQQQLQAWQTRRMSWIRPCSSYKSVKELTRCDILFAFTTPLLWLPCQRHCSALAVATFDWACCILQTLKIIRYTSRLIAAVSPPGSEQRKRFEALQSSVGTSRWGSCHASLGGPLSGSSSSSGLRVDRT